jgi:hypothetical protein
MKKIHLSLVFTIAFFQIALAQQYQVSGKITDNTGEFIPFVSIYVKNATKGVSASADGSYALTLPKGKTTLVYKAIGFKVVERVVEVNGNTIVNQTLAPESYTLNNVIIRPNAEDPAFEIMRKAIKNREKHLNEVAEFSSDVYIKGMQKLAGAPKKFLGRDVQKTLDLDTSRKGIVYLSESTSKFDFKRPNQVHEVMVSSKVSGRNNAFSWNKALDLSINFYENLLLEGNGLSSRSFVSPLADKALFYYNYKLLGTSEENGVLLNKIEVIPRRKNDPVFRGVIYIADGSWRIMGIDLFLIKDAGINLLDTLEVGQQFIKIDNYYMPSSTRFQFSGKALGFKVVGYFIGVYSNYNVKPNFSKDHFTAEVLKINKSVNKKDSLFWMNNRPIPLTEEEKFDYKKKDSIAQLKTSKRYLDSVERESNEFGLGKLFLRGYSLNYRYEGRSIYFDPIIKSVFYNTVEGLGLKYGISFRKNLTDRKYVYFRPEARYGFSNHLFTANLSGGYYYDPLKRASINASFGSDVADLNRYGSMSLFSNTINTLVFERNLPKFYKREFATISTTRELADGLQADVVVDYSRNSTLVNTSDYKFRDIKDREFTSNNPFTPTVETPLFPNYRSLFVSAALTYTIGQKYVTRPDGKFYEESKYPRIQLGYRKGIKGVFKSDTDYDLLSLEIYQERINTGLFGYMSFVFGAGKFLNNNTVFYPDSKHFRGNNSTVFPPNLRKFRYLDFYQYSTDKQYFEAHFEHNFAGFLINKIPLLRKTKLEEFVGVNYLTQPQKRNYTEYYFGLQRLVFSVSYGWAYDGNKKVDQGFRIAYGF